MSDVAVPAHNGELSKLFHYVHHPRAQAHIDGTAAKPGKVRDQAPTQTAAQRFNSHMALGITVGVGTMWAAYVFALIALASLPAILHQVSPSTFSFFPSWLLSASLLSLVAWVSSYFLQLVLLPIIIVGQNLQAKASDKRAENTYEDAEAVLHEAMQIQQHLAAQDAVMSQLIARVEALTGASPGAPGAG
jgi:hypothetical protein